MKPIFFASQAEFRAWLERNHATAAELMVGFYKKGSGRQGLTYREAVDEALAFGWIDGIVRRLDEERYMQRYTPRRARSMWSLINVRRVEELTRLGRMMPAGLAAFAARDPARSGLYAYENSVRALTPEQERRFRGNAAAWRYFQGETASYRRTAIWWVVSAARDETRGRRLATLIRDSEAGRRIASQPPRPVKKRPAKKASAKE